MGNPVNSLVANIQTATGNFVTTVNGGGLPPLSEQATFAVQANRTAAAQWETFDVVWGDNQNTFGLKTSAGNFLTAVNGGNVAANNDPIETNRTAASTWEQFTLNFTPALTVNNPINPVSGAFIGYTLPPPDTLQTGPAQTVTIETVITSNFLTAQNNGGMDVDSTGQAISTNRTQMLGWETFTLANFTPAPSFSMITVEIVTGGADLRQDSGATIQFLASNQLNPAPGTAPTPFLTKTLKAPGATGWGNNSTQSITWQLPEPLPTWVFGNLTISQQQHPSGLEDWNNWDIASFVITLFNINPTTRQVTDSTVLRSVGSENQLPDGSSGFARLTNSADSVTVTIAI